MSAQSHIVSGLYSSRAEAETARSHLLENGLQNDQVTIVERIRADDNNRKLATDDQVLKEVLVDGVVGTVVGTGIGALAELALVAANLTLFTTSPFLAPLTMLGWGASMGAIFGAAAGSNGVMKRGWFADFMLYAIRSGHVTLVANTRSEAEQSLARGVIGDDLAERSEQRAAA